MISVKNLDMNFKSELTQDKQRVLKNINFTVTQGDCLGILGESGSGKSTLGRILTGQLKPSEGAYHFQSIQPYENRKSKRALSDNISIVFQDYNTSVNPRFTVYEVILESLIVLAKRSKTKIDYKAEVISLLETVGLDETFMSRYIHQISGGQLQRICIARAIALRPKLILFDEAISSLDAHTQVQIMDLLLKL